MSETVVKNVSLRLEPSFFKAVKRAVIDADVTLNEFFIEAARDKMERERERAGAS